MAEDVEESPVSEEKGLETMEPPVTPADVKGLQVPMEEERLSASEEKGSPPTEVVPADKEPLSAVEEHPTVTAKEEELSIVTEELPLVTTEKESPEVLYPNKEGFSAVYKESPPITAVEAPSVPADKGPLPVTSQQEESPSVTTYRESPPATESGEHPPTVADKESLSTDVGEEYPSTIAYKEHSPEMSVEEPPSIPTEEAPEQVVVPPEPPTTMEEEYPTVVAYKEHPPVISVEEPPSTTTEEVAGIIERISVVPEPAVIPPEPPAEAIEEVPPWEIWHTDPAEHILLAVAITLVAGKVGGETARLLGVPAVVGKIIIGMILGNIYLLSGWDFFNFLRVMPFLKHLSEFGALTLLLIMGLRTDLRAMLRVGISSVLVALGGLVAPAGLGFLVGHFLLPESPFNTKLLLSIVLCASSMVIILKVLDELKMLHTLEGRIITGAVILGDVVTLLGFGVACGIITSGQIPLVGVIITIIIVSFFFSAIVITSLRYGEVLGNFVTRKVPEGLKLALAAIVCLFLAFLAESIGMHTIIGAFGAGLLLQHMRLKESDGKEYSIEWLIRPAYMILVPIFFVRAGAQVRWESFLDINTVFLGLALTGASVLGKLFCSLCPVERGINRLAIGLAMVPKLEVTLILASIGSGLGILNDSIFSAFVMLIVLTSTVSPPFLKTVLSRKKLVSEGPPVPSAREEIRATTR